MFRARGVHNPPQSAVVREAHSGRDMVCRARPWQGLGVSGCRAGHCTSERKGWVAGGGGPAGV